MTIYDGGENDMNRGYRIGLDIGIGSVGWAVISGKDNTARIEDAGVRIYDSGELIKEQSRKSQKRRLFRSARRLVRRRYFRKERLKAHLENIGFLSAQQITEYCSSSNENVFELKMKGISDKISKEQLALCLIHTCNHRGYKDFYESDEDNEDKETAINRKAAHEFDVIFKNSGCKTVSECICKHFTNEKTGQPEFRNRDSKETYLLIHRQHIKDEICQILKYQSKFYPELNNNAIDLIDKIIFSQRDFEDGPGDASLAFRRYTGFLKSIGKCPFYKLEDRGFRATLISDIYSVVNTLSQYRYIAKETGEYTLPPDIARQIVYTTIERGSITMTEVKSFLSDAGIELRKGENSDDKALSKAIKFISIAKKCIERADLKWNDFIGEEQFDIEKPSKLHQIGVLLSKYQTPSRRHSELHKLSFMTDKLEKELSGKKISGTAAVSDKYMCDAIEVFMNGEIYGNFQAEAIKRSVEQGVSADYKKTRIIEPSVFDDDIKDNPVVFRAINETRKIINSIINTYGSPEYINIEVASDLNRSFVERREIFNKQKKNEAENDAIRSKIAEILDISVEEVNGSSIEKYKLFYEQNGRCMYSDEILGDIADVLRDKTKRYEVDHIIPYSLILDNTLNNKALVFGSQNQIKGQRTPLMYLTGDKRKKYIEKVNYMYSRKEKPISLKKYNYFMLKDIYSAEAEDILKDWKSRNINDTRYITKYITSLLKNHLEFTGESKMMVYGIKGGLTSKFRKIWLNDKTWGNEDKNRNTYLNHAVDAVIIANLTPAYVEIASDNIKLQQIRRKFRRTDIPEYTDYLSQCIKKMRKYYGFSEEYTCTLLTKTERVPSYVPNIGYEVDIRFNDNDEDLFRTKIQEYYGNCDDFIIKPHMILTSHKPERRFRGTIADSNPVKLREIDGVIQKIFRKNVSELSAKEIDRLYTKDTDLITSLKHILDGKSADYTVGEYMSEKGIKCFLTEKGQPVYKVSLFEGKPYSNYYKKTIDKDNYTMLGMLKYYCIEIYKDTNGKTRTRGIRYVDIVKKDKKLYLKAECVPENYSEHVMYMFKNAYIEVYKKNGQLKFKGVFCSVKTIDRSMFYGKRNNESEAIDNLSIASTDIVRKYEIDILGRKGGEIKCSEPLSLIREKK